MAIIAISGYAGSGKDTVAQILQYLTSDVYKKYNKPFESNDTTYEYYGSTWQIRKFADKLKDIVCILLGCNRADLENREFKEKELGEEWNMWKVVDVNTQEVKYFSNVDDAYDYYEVAGMEEPVDSPITVRLMMQLIGTDVFRDNFNKNIWVNSLMSGYKKDWINSSSCGCRGICLKEICEPHDFLLPNWIISDLRFPNEMKAIKDRQGITIRVNRDYVLAGGPEDPKQLHESETALDNSDFDYYLDNNGTIEELIEKVKEILIKENII